MGGAVLLLIPMGVFVAVVALSVWAYRSNAPRIAEDL
jgi:hypothetical protein